MKRRVAHCGQAARGLLFNVPEGRGAGDDPDGVCRVDGLGDIGRAVHRLAVVAVTIELREGRADDLGANGAAPARDVCFLDSTIGRMV